MNKIRIIGKKTLYNLDNEQALRNWAIEPVKKLKTFDAPNFSSGIKVKTEGNTYGRNFKGAMGYFFSAANNVNNNNQNVALFSSVFSHGHGFGINKDNFERVVVSFAARKLIMPNWINSQDEYLAPDETNPDYVNFINDSIIFSLFHIHANQSSLRNVDYKNDEKE